MAKVFRFFKDKEGQLAEIILILKLDFSHYNIICGIPQKIINIGGN